jgi:hypothetical protein
VLSTHHAPRSAAEIVIFNKMVTVYMFCEDAHFYVTAHHDENELILVSVLNALVECLTKLLRFVCVPVCVCVRVCLCVPVHTLPIFLYRVGMATRSQDDVYRV